MEMVKRLVKKTKPDVAHLHNIAHQLTPSIIVALQRAGVPVVQTLHDYELICPNYKLFTQGSPCERCKAHKYWNAIKYNCVQDSKGPSALAAFELAFHNVILKTYGWGVNRFIAPSQFLHAKLLEWGWQKRQLLYVPHFVEKRRDPSIRKKQQLLFVGRLTKEKGADLLLDAAKRLPDTPILFAGAGEESGSLTDRIAAEKLTNCRLLGQLDTPALDRLVQESAAVVVPSRWYENAPLVVYEALALGTPVLGSRLGGLVELIQEGKDGLLFFPGDAADLAKQAKTLFSEKSFQPSAERFSKEDHLARITQLYEEVQNHKRPVLPV
jgi:glycosyltransferase involved in cell wall biosynthesis